MEWLYIACIGLAGVAMLVMTVIIPYGVFMRYVVNSPSSWPEPAGILLMVVFSFMGGAAAYRLSVFKELGGFDEALFAYWEDVEPDGLFLAWLAVK